MSEDIKTTAELKKWAEDKRTSFKAGQMDLLNSGDEEGVSISAAVIHELGCFLEKINELEASVRNMDDEEIQHLEKRELLRRLLEGEKT